MQRLIQTTIASDHSESAMSAIFVPNQRSEETSGVFQGLRNAGVQLIIEQQFEGLENSDDMSILLTKNGSSTRFLRATTRIPIQIWLRLF